jgi:hypothetical protein
MKNIVLLLFCLQCVFASAQIVSTPLTCSKHFLGFKFDVYFKGDVVVIKFKNETHILPFNRSWVTTHGEHWSDYTNGNLIVASSYPDEPYVAISLTNQKNAMASCDIEELQASIKPAN